MKKLILVAVLLLCVTDANAKYVTVAEYQEHNKKHKEAVKLLDPDKDIIVLKEDTLLHGYIQGIGMGLILANIQLDACKEKPLFCLPENYFNNANITRTILNQELNNPSSGTAYSNDEFIETVILLSFIERFPCNKPEPDK